jgi:hypothetical protein
MHAGKSDLHWRVQYGFLPPVPPWMPGPAAAHHTAAAEASKQPGCDVEILLCSFGNHIQRVAAVNTQAG